MSSRAFHLPHNVSGVTASPDALYLREVVEAMRADLTVRLLTAGVAQSEGAPLDEEDLESIAEALDIFPPTSAGYASKARSCISSSHHFDVILCFHVCICTPVEHV